MTSHLSQTKPTTEQASSGRVSWQQELKEAIRSAAELCQFLHIDPAAICAEEVDFPVLVPRAFARRIERGNPTDPLLKQVLATASERDDVDGFVTDPIGEEQAQLAPGILRKYSSRALMITTGGCAVHCRYCFRRHFPYSESPSGLEQWQPSLDAIWADEQIEEILLSGGDPLVLPDQRLAQLLIALADIPHLKHVRIHTRTPVVIPSRITDSLVDLLKSSRLKVWFVIHANHANELDGEVFARLSRLQSVGIPVLNQAVLLKGVNDDEDTLFELCKRLMDVQILPYYLHQLDSVAGASHFHVPVEEGRALIAQIRKRLPGYAVPRYVQEIAGEQSKTVLA